MRYLVFVCLALVVGCGTEECQLSPGTWSCQLVVTSTTCAGISVGQSVQMKQNVAEDEDLSCQTGFINEGPEYIAAADMYMWVTGSLTPTDGEHMSGQVSYRYSPSSSGESSCTVVGEFACSNP